VVLGREPAAGTPDAFRADLGRYLAHLGLCLQEAGRPAQAGPAALEAVELLTPGADRPESASALTTAGLVLTTAGRPEGALAAFEAIVAACRRLAGIDPVRHGPSLVEALQLLAGRLGRLPEAVAVTEEVVAPYRRDCFPPGGWCTGPYLLRCRA
jgi:hypothetical protein